MWRIIQTQIALPREEKTLAFPITSLYGWIIELEVEMDVVMVSSLIMAVFFFTSGGISFGMYRYFLYFPLTIERMDYFVGLAKIIHE